MRRSAQKIFKIAGLIVLLLFTAFMALMELDVIWRSPAYYNPKSIGEFEHPVMSMKAYDTLGFHHRPYIYHLKKGKGEVYVLGIDHTKDTANPQIDSIQAIWKKFKPEVAFVEGRLGFLLSWLQDPVSKYGEGGKTLSLAKRDKISAYTWEPEREDEIKMLLQKYDPVHVALFYSLRPYFSNYRFGKPEDPDRQMKDYIKSRTNYAGIKNQLKGVHQVDSIWQKDFPDLPDWRETTDEFGWPPGYLSDIAAFSNELRDIHMCSAVIEQVNLGRRVFITMGSSHAFRIKETLLHELRPVPMDMSLERPTVYSN